MPTEIVDGIHDITCLVRDGGGRIRAYLVEDDVPTLFDCGLPDSTDALFDGLADVGVEPERLVITHGDPDHIGGFDAVVESYDVETYVPEQTDADTEHEPDHRFGDGDHIGSFEAVHLPGHEPDNYALIDEGRGVAVLGDALSGADQRGLPEGYFHLPPAVYSGDLNQAEASLEKLQDYAFDVGLVFHGTSVLENARDVLDRYVYRIPGT
jgi:glyoxylase-like metal-dependent hydrolase (beta-lactamase superfamily II)